MSLDLLVLGGTSINDEVNYGLEAVDFGPPPKKLEWANSADADGSDLVRTPRYENRVVTMTLRVGPQASKNAALEKVGALADLLQECEKNPGGSPLEWTPASSTKTVTLYVLTGAITAIPMTMEGSSAGYYQNAPQLTVVLTCKPFGYGAEVEVAAAKSIETGLSVVVLTIPTVGGDVPAEGRLVIKDTATVGRRFVEWGVEQRYYNAATSLILDSEDMTPVGGTQVTSPTGAYKRAGATKNTIETVLLPEPTICCETGVLKHVGTFRVKARVYCAIGGSLPTKASMRLSWQDGEGPFSANDWVQAPVANLFAEVDLGTISVSPAAVGSQKWTGKIEAYSGNVAGFEDLYIDYLTFIPVGEGYGQARGVQSSAPGTISAFDNLTTGTLSGSLNARTPAVGTAWATSGAATDWTVTAGAVTRKTVSDTEPRFGVLGAAIGSGVVTIAGTFPRTLNGNITLGAVTRWTNSSNYAFAIFRVTLAGGCTLELGVRVAGVTTILATQTLAGVGFFVTALNAKLTATLDGALTVTTTTGGKAVTLGVSSSAIATGGALASGKSGIYDLSAASEAATRTFTSVQVSALAAIPYCIQPSRTMEVRSDSTLAQDSTGTYYGPVPRYRGSRFFVPQDGSANRTSRVIVKADQNDLEESDATFIGVAFTAAVWATPRYSVIPR
jgi:hypothetical protein